jgi:hypothetical protein
MVLICQMHETRILGWIDGQSLLNIWIDRPGMRIAFGVFLGGEILLDVAHAISNKWYSDAEDCARIHVKRTIFAILCTGALYRLVIQIACSCIYLFVWPINVYLLPVSLTVYLYINHYYTTLIKNIYIYKSAVLLGWTTE